VIRDRDLTPEEVDFNSLCNAAYFNELWVELAAGQKRLMPWSPVTRYGLTCLLVRGKADGKVACKVDIGAARDIYAAARMLLAKQFPDWAG
jgi:hypothetical protein